MMKKIFKFNVAIFSVLITLATSVSCSVSIGNGNDLVDDEDDQDIKETVYSASGKVFIDRNASYCTIYSFNTDNTFDDYVSRWMGSKANMDFAHNSGTYVQEGNKITFYKNGNVYDRGELKVYNGVLCLVVNASGYDLTDQTAKEVMDGYLAEYAHN